ncbi:hypothetical protein [Neobacillus sp. 19]
MKTKIVSEAVGASDKEGRKRESVSEDELTSDKEEHKKQGGVRR